jgi:hypothetical protein
MEGKPHSTQGQERLGQSPGALEKLRRIRGVSWQWRPDVPLKEISERAGETEAGVIAQEVQAVFPELVSEGEAGYLRVDYGGLAAVLAQAVGELSTRIEGVAGGPATTPSDENLKDGVDPIADALSHLGGEESLSATDQTALIGALVEAVKELDRRLTELERHS